MIFLDTHVVVWLYSGKIDMLSKKASDLIENGDLFISPAVTLELQYLKEIKRITSDPFLMLQKLSDSMDLKVSSDFFQNIVVEAIAQTWTRDPFDRLIVSNAVVHHSVLISKDLNILEHYRKAVW